ncbi:hypothetical protein DCC39_15840 [Pueribacillus theae]|uniref:Uncharacterized protein n=1 Tax=Pueribacillus theae TaxID=2171751 RepID=A0A2U1JSJ9_9BACI|nr:hypothetical protein [Pueribacillus theae]PWA07914.1 hypothetical protein DCC39_15840 [Pueribacillus theae]
MGLNFFLIVIIIVLIAFFTIRSKVQVRFGKPLFIGYALLLLLSFALYEFVISKNITVINPVSEAEEEKEVNKFFEAINEGNIDKIESAYIVKQDEVDFQSNKLMIETEDDDYFDPSVVVERKPENDQKIDVIYYKTKPLIKEIDIMKEIKPIQMNWKGDTLTFMKPEEATFDFAMFKKEFPISQFTGEDWFELNSNGFIGYQVIYLRVPKDLQIEEKSDVFIDYVGEEE